MTELLPRSLILDLHQAAVALGLPRAALLARISPAFVAALDETPSKSAQILMDLSKLNSVEKLKNGSVPLRIWLENAKGLVAEHDEKECAFFQNALNQLGEASPHPRPQTQSPGITPIMAVKTKILFLSANPAGRDRLAIGREFNAVESELLKAPDGRQLSLIPAFDTGAGELSRVLLEHEPNVLHFSGHGDPSGKLVITSRLGGGDKIEADALARLLESFKTHLRCVVLNACFSKIVGDALREHIDVVIGMSRAISDDAAIQFSTGFYRAIAFHKDVNTAFKLALSQIDLSHLPDADKPQLLCKVGTDSNTVVLFPKSS